jgi:hypothetical protein
MPDLIFGGTLDKMSGGNKTDQNLLLTGYMSKLISVICTPLPYPLYAQILNVNNVPLVQNIKYIATKEDECFMNAYMDPDTPYMGYPGPGFCGWVPNHCHVTPILKIVVELGYDKNNPNIKAVTS